MLPEGTFAVHLSPDTREAFELVPNWDLSVLEPQKVIQLDKIKEDLKTKGESSDFFPLSSHITVNIFRRNFHSIPYGLLIITEIIDFTKEKKDSLSKMGYLNILQ